MYENEAKMFMHRVTSSNHTTSFFPKTLSIAIIYDFQLTVSDAANALHVMASKICPIV